MNPSRPLLKATTATNAAAAAATRTRTARAKGDAPDAPGELIPPSRDLIGPPCPLSNLRPVYYAPLFPSLHSPSGWGDLAAAAAAAAAATDGDAAADAAPLPSLWTAARGAAQTAATTPAPPRRRVPRPRKPHPYSLAEFPTLSTTTSSSSRPRSSTTTTAATTTTTTVSSDPNLVRLERVRQRLHAQDLEWRWARYRFDAFNQAFWTRMNERFLRGREAYLLAAAASARADAQGVDSEGRHGEGGGGRVTDRRKEGGDSLSSSSSSSSRPNVNPNSNTNPNSNSNSHSNPNSNPGVEGTQAVDLAPFYAQHLAETKRAYADYNKQLWRFQAGLIWPAVRASARSWRWRFEVWRAGGARDGRLSSSSSSSV